MKRKYMYVLQDHNPSVCGHFETDWHWEDCDDHILLECIAEELMEYLWNFEKHLRNVFPTNVLIWDEKKDFIGTFKLEVKMNPVFKAKRIK